MVACMGVPVGTDVRKVTMTKEALQGQTFKAFAMQSPTAAQEHRSKIMMCNSADLETQLRGLNPALLALLGGRCRINAADFSAWSQNKVKSR